MNKWVSAAIVIVAALIIGAVLARVVRNLIDRPKFPEGVRKAATPIASLAFSAALMAGLITALGFVNKDALDQLPKDFIAYIPKAMSAAIVFIAARVVASVVSVAVEGSVRHMSPTMQVRIPMIVKVSIIGCAALIAANQLGVDTTVINLAAGRCSFPSDCQPRSWWGSGRGGFHQR